MFGQIWMSIVVDPEVRAGKWSIISGRRRNMLGDEGFRRRDDTGCEWMINELPFESRKSVEAAEIQ